VATLQPAAEQILVCVGTQAITGAPYLHWLGIAQKVAEPPAKGQPPQSAAELRDEVLGFLISSDWVLGEAGARHVSATDVQVRRQFDRLRAQQFPHRGELERFERESGQSVADLLLRVRLNLDSERIQKQVISGQHGAGNQQRALAKFVKAFKSRWQAQTYCAAQFAVDDCGHVQSVL
jgi:hypothetical protein